MRFFEALVFGVLATIAAAQSTDGIYSLVQRRMPNHANKFVFSLVNVTEAGAIDHYAVSSTSNGTILVEASSLSALSYGLHRYLADVAHVDLFWFIGNRLDIAPSKLPTLDKPLTGSSIVPWRYHFNTVTFSYTTAYWTWEDWELQLDWMALRGVNLPLAWVGYEKILVEVFQELGLTDDEISSFLSGPSFQSWNRFANIQGSWGGPLPTEWLETQFALQKRIVARMVDLGMTPALPAFTGFVPRGIHRVLPDAQTVNGTTFSNFPLTFTNVTFLEPSNAIFPQLMNSFISKQMDAYGNITHIYTLDQYNENNPASGDLNYLRNVTFTTWQSLKAANPAAVWLLQGWLFFSSESFWTNDRVEAYLSGVENNSDMLILDLFSETQPQWQRTNSYFGKPWIWCELHDFGGNMGLYGQIENVTINPIQSLANSSSLVGFGLTMEGQEGNEIMYDLLLDQAWSETPIETTGYFHDFVTRRYAGHNTIPQQLYEAWETLRPTVFNNTNLTSQAVSKSIFELEPSISGLTNRTGHHPTTIDYAPSLMVFAWNLLYNASATEPALWKNPAYLYDLVDFTRQVMGNAFIPMYNNLIASYNQNVDAYELNTIGLEMVDLLQSLDAVLFTNDNFLLSTWIEDARSWSDGNSSIADFYEYDARNQLTLWGPDGEISDYASKSWAGLVSSYYIPRWSIFVNYLVETSPATYNATALHGSLLSFELQWQQEKTHRPSGTVGHLKKVLTEVVQKWPAIFSDI